MPATHLALAAAGAPKTPGVYFFVDADHNLLYVGKAANLRSRLQQHAKATPPAGRSAALYARTVEVRWEDRADADAAAARGADLIVALRPPYNAAISGRRWVYIQVLDHEVRDIRFELTKDATRQPRVYGCFPHLGRGVSSASAIACSEGYTALLRLLWAASGAGEHYPRAVAGVSPPERFIVALDRPLTAALHAFLSGTSARLLPQLESPISAREAYMQPALARDRQSAAAFFRYGPAAIRQLRLRHRCPPGALSRAQIERLLAAEVRQSIGDFRRPADQPDLDAGMRRRSRQWVLESSAG